MPRLRTQTLTPILLAALRAHPGERFTVNDLLSGREHETNDSTIRTCLNTLLGQGKITRRAIKREHTLSNGRVAHTTPMGYAVKGKG